MRRATIRCAGMPIGTRWTDGQTCRKASHARVSQPLHALHASQSCEIEI